MKHDINPAGQRYDILESGLPWSYELFRGKGHSSFSPDCSQEWKSHFPVSTWVWFITSVFLCVCVLCKVSSWGLCIYEPNSNRSITYLTYTVNVFPSGRDRELWDLWFKQKCKFSVSVFQFKLQDAIHRMRDANFNIHKEYELKWVQTFIHGIP